MNEGGREMSKTILVVDDERDIRYTLRALLVGRGYEVEEAEDGRVALDKINSRDFDLVVLDLMMPNMSGYEVVRELSPEFMERTPIVLLTAKGEDKDIMKGYSMGATYYISKPFTNQRIIDITEYLIGNLTAGQKEKIEVGL